MDRYYAALLEQMHQVRQTQWHAIALAAEWLGQSLANDGWLYAFGTGHSHALAEEIFYRAGNPARATPMLDSRLMLHEKAIEATYNEREHGYETTAISQNELLQLPAERAEKDDR